MNEDLLSVASDIIDKARRLGADTPPARALGLLNLSWLYTYCRQLDPGQY